MDFPNSELWTYSTQIWTLPEVETICLELQNNYDANINMLLYCCWVGDKNLNLNDDDLQTLLDAVQPWQIIIKPLRDSRKMMQQHLIAMPAEMVDQTVSNMSEMELNAEHMTQLALEKALKPEKISPCESMGSIECSFSNIKAYINSLDSISSVNEIMPQIGQLLTAIFQDEEAVQMAMMSNA
ncbi:MAG: TIGR02444 family protein [endosymbiont of Galathealinum brachiosum]|uniref:TIGR02444 family protein n=1 Tax=endosymbiont of Galathealinum brachiosum TaxID=2200906 RepID=A0A370DET7_9GAMM|nr:MAG: TIGR02444 family protein [endosymbiont of Galathealinum brachiosum]